MTLEELLFYLTNKDLDKFEFYRSMFSIPLQDTDYYKFDKENKKVILTHNNKEISLTDRETVLELSDSIELDKYTINNPNTGTFKLGDVLYNYLLVVYPFGKNRSREDLVKLLPFKEKLSFEDVEDVIADHRGDLINAEEHTSFVEATDMIQQMSSLFVVASTIKSISPAPGQKEYVKKLFKEYKEKYGEEFYYNIQYIVELEEKIIAYDREYLKDDPTYGITTNEKIITNARKNLFGTIGAEIGMDGEMTEIIENSLMEYYPENNEQLADLFNSSRKASIFRGYMTQFTGNDANITSAVLNSVLVAPTDCKTRHTYDIILTKDLRKNILGFNIMENGKAVMLTADNVDKYIDKKIKLRTYLYCQEENDRYCSVCAGRAGADNKNIAIILSTAITSKFTNTSMKAMHNKSLKIVEYDFNDSIS